MTQTLTASNHVWSKVSDYLSKAAPSSSECQPGEITPWSHFLTLSNRIYRERMKAYRMLESVPIAFERQDDVDAIKRVVETLGIESEVSIT